MNYLVFYQHTNGSTVYFLQLLGNSENKTKYTENCNLQCAAGLSMPQWCTITTPLSNVNLERNCNTTLGENIKIKNIYVHNN